MRSLGIAQSVKSLKVEKILKGLPTPDRASEAYTIRVFRKTVKGVSFVITVVNLIITSGIRQSAIAIIVRVGGIVRRVNLIELQCRIMRRPLTLHSGNNPRN